jgi:glucose-6-phosphate 1-dehydrogenase
MNPTIIIVLGATGDLMQRKIAPSLWQLYKQGKLPETFKIIGFARKDLSNANYRTWIKDALNETDPQLNNFLNNVQYFQGNLDNQQDYQNLGKEIGVIDGEIKACTNKIFYLAIPPINYQNVMENLSGSGLTKSCSEEEGWTRVLIEKPFGSNLKSAKELDKKLSTLFKEEQIYRIDHYLAKEMVQDILTFRFSNNLFEHVWGGEHIEKIEINLLETLDVKNRGAFYDGVGALRDVGQNHILQILSLLIMDNPGAMDPKLIRKKRALAFNYISIPTKNTIKKYSYRAQYQGYLDTKGVAENSTTETFFKIKFSLNGPKWNGVPVYIQAGKSLKEVKKEAVITFKHPEPCLCPVGQKHHLRNVVRISLEPKEGINIDFWAKKPGLEFKVEKRSMDFLLREKDPQAQYTQEYQKLLFDSLAGDQTLFANSDEVEKMWSIVDPIIETWQKDNIPSLEKYEKGTDQPILSAIQKEKDIKESNAEKQIAVVGLGKMGANLARRMMKTGWKVTGYNRSMKPAQELEKEGLNVALKITDLPWILKGPRLIWLMVPAGKVIDDILFGEEGLAYRLSPGDTIVDGGNSFYQNSINRAQKLKEKGINFIDIGVSGGPQGALTGPCLIVGGEAQNQDIVRELCNDLALNDSVRFFPGEGMGHFVKMVHNAIEYGMMQSIAEGMEVLKQSPVPIDLIAATQIYNNRSVIESRLVGWLENSYKERGTDLTDISSTVSHSGEAEWTIKIAKKMGVDIKTIEESFNFRVHSKDNPRYAGKVVAALREQFGGHKATKE